MKKSIKNLIPMSKIEWTDRTWNPLAGCSIISKACDNCYAMKMAFRLEHMGQEKYKGTTRKTESGRIVWTGKINTDEKALLAPLKWKKPQRVFVNSMSDLFYEHLDRYYIDQVFAVMAATPHITYQILTKRPDQMALYLNDKELGHDLDDAARRLDLKKSFNWPLPNVWLGTTLEDQKTADERIPHLLKCPAAVRFLSCEPLLGPISLDWMYGNPPEKKPYADSCINHLNWVIAGGESGSKARPSHPDWFRSLRDQCQAAGVPFFFKQWGEWLPIDHLGEDQYFKSKASAEVGMGITSNTVFKVGKNEAGNLLDGKEWNEFPEAGRNEGEK